MITSKLEGLNFLKEIIKDSEIEVPFYLSENVLKIKKNKDLFIKRIINNFKGSIIIRSSANNEDNLDKSNAGLYLSKQTNIKNLLNLRNSLDLVLKLLNSNKDKIIIQKLISNVEIAGVLFTREINKPSPYYVINYDRSKKTDLITSGQENPSLKSLYIYRESKNIPKKFLQLINIVKKIEKKFKNKDLDIEFAIKKKKVYIFQCRYLKTIKPIHYKFNIPLNNLYKKIKKISVNPFLNGKKTIFSNMSDWNPAEMIGTKPKSLALSLYKNLITDEVWALQRKNYGYKNVQPNKLMYNFLGSPYIDLKTDLNSFLPKNLNQKIAEEVINNSITKLKQNNYLHDKIEFEIIETFFNFNTNEKLRYFLNKEQANKYKYSLLKLTNNIIENKKLLPYDINKIDKLRNKVDQINCKKISEIQKIYFILDLTKKYGSLPFAGIARCAFISTSFLKFFKKNNIISNEQYNNFFKALQFLNNNRFKNSKKLFIKLYGHIRPSNYSISNLNYKENFNKYFENSNFKIKKKINKRFFLDNDQKKKINSLIKKNNYKFNLDELFVFFKKSIYHREKAKIDFIYGIDKIFENLIKLGKEINVSRSDFEYLDIKTIIDSYENLEFQKLGDIIKKNIKINKKNYQKNQYIILPNVITSEKQIYTFHQQNSVGNFITENKIISKIIFYKKNLDLNKIKNKIICIENADPGYDFIFNYEINGLITKYGGANSHMSIRCLEKSLPACIGIGEKYFENLNHKNKIFLDCKNKIIKQII